ncbi:hypothetical protein WJX72_009449 [[Myrmecia] bisecta]|uniref:Uncharacterized protein n=1 Tax=[Myrmecia] bisecta TaxID=41462 RepID=A0AAW1R941_9CHLO
MTQNKRKRQTSTPFPVDLVGCRVAVPALVFKVEEPDLYYTGTVTSKAQIKGKSKVQAAWVYFDDDKKHYWFPVEHVQSWVVTGQVDGDTVRQQAHAQRQQEVAQTGSDTTEASELVCASASQAELKAEPVCCGEPASGGQHVQCSQEQAAHSRAGSVSPPDVLSTVQAQPDLLRQPESVRQGAVKQEQDDQQTASSHQQRGGQDACAASKERTVDMAALFAGMLGIFCMMKMSRPRPEQTADVA